MHLPTIDCLRMIFMLLISSLLKKESRKYFWCPYLFLLACNENCESVQNLFLYSRGVGQARRAHQPVTFWYGSILLYASTHLRYLTI